MELTKNKKFVLDVYSKVLKSDHHARNCPENIWKSERIKVIEWPTLNNTRVLDAIPSKSINRIMKR